MPTAIKQFISVKTDNLSLRRNAVTAAVVAVFLFVLPVTGVFLYTRGRAHAATASTLNFQARLLDNTGQVVADGSYNIQFNLYTIASGGATQWTETHTVSGGNAITVKNGYFSVNLGDSTTGTAFPNTINWDQEQWLGMTVRGTGTCAFGACTPTDAEMTPRFKLTSVPYAFRAGQLMDTTGNAFTANDLIQKNPATPQVINSALAAIRLNQTSTGGLLQLQNTGTDVFTVANNGDTSTAGSLTVVGGTATLGSVSQAGSLVLSDGTSNTTTLQAGSSASNLTFTLPTSYGNNGDCLTGNGAGVLTFAATCGGTLSVNPTANVRKSADETQNNVVNPTAVLQNDDELFFAIGANETWSYRFVISANAAAAPDIKFAVIAPVGATCRSGVQDAEGATTIANLACGASSGLVPGNTAEDVYEVTGTVVNGATAGNVTLQWAQNTVNAANVIVRQGSYLNANRIAGPGQTAQAFIQNGNSFNALAILGTNDNNALSVRTNGIERLRILATGEITAADDIVAQGAATGTTGTTSGVGAANTTTITLAAAGAFANNDVIFVDNTGGSGQDYYTRIVSGGGTTTLTVSPAVSYGSAAGYTGNATITKYTTQNIGATTTDYTTQANRFFQGYFLGGITVGTNSTTLSDGLLSRTVGDIVVEPGTGGAVQVNGTLNATTINATTITGDGSGITNINGASISGGSIADSSLSSNVALLNASQTFSAAQSFGAGLSIAASQSLSLNGDAISDLSGTGLTVSGGSLQTTLGTSIDLTAEVTGALTIANGGTGGTTAQDAINNIAGLTTAGDLLYYDGTNATRLAKGANGECLTATNTGLAWASCTTGAVTSVGTLDSQIKVANGAQIIGGALILQTADATQAGLVSTSAQTFAGDKTFSGQIIGTNGLSVAGTTTINTTGTATTAIGNATGALTLTGSNGSTFVLDGVTLDTTELGRLDGVNAALIDTNDAVQTAITGTGALTVGSIGGSFGNINIGTNTFTGNGSGITSLNGTNISSGTIADARLSSNVVLLNGNNTFSGTATFNTTLTADSTVNLNGTTIIGNASTDRLTITGQLLGANALVFQGATDNTFATTFAVVDPTGSNVINIPDASGTIAVSASGNLSLGVNGNITTNNAVSFSTSVTTPVITSTGALSISSGGSSALTLDSASNTIVIASSDTTLQRTAAGNFSLDLNDAAATAFIVTNSAAGVANLNLAEGDVQTAGTTRLTNGGALQNINGLTIASGGANITGNSTLADNVSINGNTTLGDAATDRVTITSQLLGANALVFQGASDNAFATTFAVTDPTANNTITIPNESGTLTLIAPANAQVDSSTNSSVFINKTGATGNLLTLQKNSAGVFTIGNNGATTISTTATAALDIKNAGGTSYFTVDTSNGLVQVGNATADSTAVVLINDAKNTTGDPAAGATSVNGAQYYNSFWQQYRCYRDGTWETCGVNPIDRAFAIEDEFISGTTVTNTACAIATVATANQNWTCFANGNINTAYNTGAILPSANRPGILRMTTTAANNNGFTIAMTGNNSGSVVIASQNRVKTTVGQGAVIANNSLRVGLHNQTTTNARPVSGVWWEAASTVNANWQYCYGNGAAATCASSGVAIAASTMYSLDIRVNSVGAGTSSVTFVINGTAFTVNNVTVDSTNRVNPAISCYNTNNLAHECYVDYYQFTGVASARR